MASTVTAPVEAGPIEKLREELAEIEERVVVGFTLADAMREGSRVTNKLEGSWVDGLGACSMGSAWISAKARGYIK